MSVAPALVGLAADLAHRIDAATSPSALDEAMRRVYAAFGRLGADEVEALQARIDVRRGAPRKSQPLPPPRVLGRFAPRRRQVSPDKERSRARRRRLAGDLPPAIREQFTEAERAALVIVAGEVKHHGVCDLAIDHIAALAGCSRTTVQNALREAGRLGLVRVTLRPRNGLKNLPNLIEIASAAWWLWIKRGPAAHKPSGFKSFAGDRKVNPTKSIQEGRGLQGKSVRPDRRDRERGPANLCSQSRGA